MQGIGWDGGRRSTVVTFKGGRQKKQKNDEGIVIKSGILFTLEVLDMTVDWLKVEKLIITCKTARISAVHPLICSQMIWWMWKFSGFNLDLITFSANFSFFFFCLLCVGAGLVWVCQKLLIYWESPTQPCLGFTSRKIPSEWQCSGYDGLVSGSATY